MLLGTPVRLELSRLLQPHPPLPPRQSQPCGVLGPSPRVADGGGCGLQPLFGRALPGRSGMRGLRQWPARDVFWMHRARQRRRGEKGLGRSQRWIEMAVIGTMRGQGAGALLMWEDELPVRSRELEILGVQAASG